MNVSSLICAGIKDSAIVHEDREPSLLEAPYCFMCHKDTSERWKTIKIPSYNGLQPPIYVIVSQRSLISAGQRLCLSSLYLQLEVHQAGDSEGEGSKEEAESDPLEADSQQVIRYLIFNIQYLVVSR